MHKEYMANYAGPEGTIGNLRSLVRTAHAHGNLMAIVNILYGTAIDGLAISEGLKNTGSWLAIAGAVVLPLKLIGIGFGIQPAGPLATLGGLLMIAAILILALGNFAKK